MKNETVDQCFARNRVAYKQVVSKEKHILYTAVSALAVITLAFCLAICSGCATYDAMVVAVHDSLDELKKGETPTVPQALTNVIPATVKPEGCGCDLSKPRAIFGVTVLGATESKVGEWLRKRWASGTDDSCGGLPHDVRPRAICPSGKSFGWKYAITKGYIKIRFEGNNMAISCGDVTVEGLTQRWHFVGTSDHTSREGWKDCKPGEWTPIAKHAWFEIR